MTRHSLRLLVSALVVLAPLAACGGDDNGGTGSQVTPTSDRIQTEAMDITADATYEYIVPYGTSVKIDSGQEVNLMPPRLDVKVGESIRISNQDTRDYMIGVFFVKAGQVLAMRFTNPGTLTGTCEMNSEGQFTIEVTE